MNDAALSSILTFDGFLDANHSWLLTLGNNSDNLPRCMTRGGLHNSGNFTFGEAGEEIDFRAGRSTVNLYIRSRVIIDVYMVCALCLIGFVGNGLTIAVLCRDPDKTNSTNMLLQTLAVVDTVYLIACVFVQPLKTLQEMTSWIGHLKDYFPYWEPYIWPLASIAQTMTVWLVVMVTIDRYVAVCRPFQTHLRNLRQVKLYVIGVMLGAIAYNIPQFFEREVSHHDPCTNQATVTKTAFGQNKLYYVLYKVCCYMIFRSIGPLVTLLVLNLVLVQTLRKTSIRTRSSVLSTAVKSTKHRENITLMLVVVVSVFIVCQLPDVVLRIAINLATSIPSLAPDRDYYRYVNAITNLMLTLNSSVNFLIYCLVGKKFRRIFVQLFFSRRCANNEDAMTEFTELKSIQR